MTDEQMKELVKWARTEDHSTISYFDLFHSLNQELLVQICYNVHKEFEGCFDPFLDTTTTQFRIKVLSILSDWLKSNDSDRRNNFTLTKIPISVPHNSATYGKQGMSLLRQPLWATISVIMLHNGVLQSNYAIECCQMMRQAKIAQIYCCADVPYEKIYQYDTVHIIAKTILEYYGEDFETFKVLYL